MDERTLLHFRTRPAVAEQIKRLAEADQRSVSTYVARLIERAVAKQVDA
jgi:predicted HicB family RNase H-like nuclease